MNNYSKKAALGAAVGALLYGVWVLLAEVTSASNTLQPTPLQFATLGGRLAIALLIGAVAGGTFAPLVARLGMSRRSHATAGAAAGAAAGVASLALAITRGQVIPPLAWAVALAGLAAVGAILGLVALIIARRGPPRHLVSRRPL
jgi:hypothetical protein